MTKPKPLNVFEKADCVQKVDRMFKKLDMSDRLDAIGCVLAVDGFRHGLRLESGEEHIRQMIGIIEERFRFNLKAIEQHEATLKAS